MLFALHFQAKLSFSELCKRYLLNLSYVFQKVKTNLQTRRQTIQTWEQQPWEQMLSHHHICTNSPSHTPWRRSQTREEFHQIGVHQSTMCMPCPGYSCHYHPTRAHWYHWACKQHKSDSMAAYNFTKIFYLLHMNYLTRIYLNNIIFLFNNLSIIFTASNAT